MIEKCKMLKFLKSFNLPKSPKSLKSRVLVWGASSRLKSPKSPKAFGKVDSGAAKPKSLKSPKSPKFTWIMGAVVDLLKSFKLLELPKPLRFFKSPKTSSLEPKCEHVSKSPKTLKLLKSLGLFVAIAPLVFLFGGCSGWGWFVPYNLQPSYWEFKKICKLNKLPNNEEKYNKVLGYFGESLDSLDWDELNKKAHKMGAGNRHFVKDKVEYTVDAVIKKTDRYEAFVELFANKNGMSRDNITFIRAYSYWDTRRKFLSLGHEGNMRVDFIEESVDCYDMNTMYYIPDFFNNGSSDEQ